MFHGEAQLPARFLIEKNATANPNFIMNRFVFGSGHVQSKIYR